MSGFYLRRDRQDTSCIAAWMYEQTCRSGFDAPGFCVLDVGSAIDSVAFRQLMVALKRAMAAIHEKQRHETLIYLSAGRFDQQESTKPHLDGGPRENLLMLGYEPSGIDSELEMFDYARCAHDLGISPQEFMQRHNPMFSSGARTLRPYATPVDCFDPARFQIVCINNSHAPFSSEGSTWQGVLHTAQIPRPDESGRRVINSTMIAPAPLGSEDVIGQERVENFMHTTHLSRRGYDKPHLEDDN
jgi:hypothetical protein